MTIYITFTNPGEIDPRLITTLGVNVKDGPSPIGFFGTGLKYALAVALRLDCKVIIQSGLRSWTFETKTEIIRGKTFGLIQMIETDGPTIPLGFTTDLGKNWEPWMAYREFWCNCKDESGSVEAGTSILSSSPNLTRVILQGEPMTKAHSTRNEWLLESEPFIRTPEVNIHRGPTQAIFYRGIKVGKLPKPTLYTYNIQSEVTLTEDRTLEAYSATNPIMNGLAHHVEDKAFLKEILLEQKSYEKDLNWSWLYRKPSPTFISVVEDLAHTRPATMSRQALSLCKEHITPPKLQSLPITRVETAMLARARGFLSKLGHEITYPIIIVETLGHQGIEGMAKDEQILIPRATFGKGTKYLASTLLEEQLHLQHGMADCSRELQNWLFDRLMSLGEEIQGEPI